MTKNNISTRSNPPHKSYKYIAVIFVILAFLLIIGVTYLALSKVTITLIPSNNKIMHHFDLTITDGDNNSTSTSSVISGRIFDKEIDTSRKFFIESNKEIDARAEGDVIIYNNRNTKQTLVATTRLLSSDNVLFRLKDKIIIPANSNIRVKIYADKKGASGNIGPSNFTIPGLPENLQKLVYAKSESSMVGGIRKIGTLTASDVEKAKFELEKIVSEQAVSGFTKNLNNDKLILIGTNTKTDELNTDKQLGNEVDSFVLSGKVLVQAVFADRLKILDIAKNNIKESQGEKGEFINVDPSSLKYELLEINTEKKRAKVKVDIQGVVNLDPSKNIFDKNLLVGFTEEDLKLYFSQFDSIKDIQVKFSPFWVKKVPILRDHIIIKVQ